VGRDNGDRGQRELCVGIINIRWRTIRGSLSSNVNAKTYSIIFFCFVSLTTRVVSAGFGLIFNSDDGNVMWRETYYDDNWSQHIIIITCYKNVLFAESLTLPHQHNIVVHYYALHRYIRYVYTRLLSSILNWWSSVCLWVCAHACRFVYNIRNHYNHNIRIINSRRARVP